MNMKPENNNEQPALIVWEPFGETSTKYPDWRGYGVRARVPGGWFVNVAGESDYVVYVPDPGHTWGTEVQP